MIIQHDTEELRRMEMERRKRLDDLKNALQEFNGDQISETLNGFDVKSEDEDDEKASA